MSDRYYVTTDELGIEHTVLGPVTWTLPNDGPATTDSQGTPLVLRHAAALLEDLDARIFLAEPDGPGTDHAGLYEVQRARLLASTAWDNGRAARLAIECAQHALGDAGSVVLPHGHTIDEVLADARASLEAASPEAEERLGFLARVRATRRLRHSGATIQEIALELLTEDGKADRNVAEDPAWSTAASVADAVLAAVEALRAYALPRFVAAREETESDERGEDAPPTNVVLTSTPWGTISPGADHRPAYDPAWAAARDAAARARDAVRERDGESAAAAELAYQADLLEQLL